MSASAQPSPIRYAPGPRGVEQRRYEMWSGRSLSSSDRVTDLGTAFRPDSSPPSYHPLVTVEQTEAPIKSSAELLIGNVARGQRVLGGRLLANLGLTDAESELGDIERHLLSTERRLRTHAAFSARQLLKELADALFPRQDAAYTDRFGEAHEVGAAQVGNRLMAFIDTQGTLAAREQKDIGAAMGFVNDWTGEGVHTAWSTERSHRAYMRLLDVLAAVGDAYDASLAPGDPIDPA